MNQPFLYLDTAEISEADLDKLSESGFIPIKVKSFDDVQILETVLTGGSDFSGAMVDALCQDTSYANSVRQSFARNLLKRLKDRT